MGQHLSNRVLVHGRFEPSRGRGMDNRRRYSRAKLRVPIMTTIEGEIVRKMVSLETRDISVGGLSFETGRELPLASDTVILVSKLGDLPDWAHIQGRIAHRRQDPESGRYTVGVEFTDFVNVTRDELAAKIASWEAAVATSD